MTSFVQPSFSFQHAGVDRAEAAAFVVAPLRRLTARALAALQAWRLSIDHASEDHKLWELALSDARVMADISRAMKQGAPNKVAFY